jgi:hypothetical protein
MHLNYQRKTLTALFAASVSILQPFLSATAENRTLLADAEDSSVRDSVLYRPRWSTPGTGHIGKLELAPILPPQPAADANSNAPVPDAGSAPTAGTPSVISQPIIQAAPAKPKPRNGAPFEWPHADDPPVQPAKRTMSPAAQPVAQHVAQHTAQPVTQQVASPVAQHVAQQVAQPKAQPVAQRKAEPLATDLTEQTQPITHAPLKIQRLTLSPPAGTDTDSPPALPKPTLPKPSLPAPAMSNSALPKLALPKPVLPKPALPDSAMTNPSAIVPSLSSGNLGETDENNKPAEAPTPGKHDQSAEKLGSPAAFNQTVTNTPGIHQALYSGAPHAIIAFDTTSSPRVSDGDAVVGANASVAPPATVEATTSKAPLAATVEATASKAAIAAAEARTSTAPTSQTSGTDASTSQRPPIIIESGISIWDTANIDKIIETLVDSHFSNSKEAQVLDKKVEHFSKAPAKAVAIVKDSLNTSMRIGGTDPSARGGRIVLDENLKISDKATAEYERQRYVDKIHSHIVSALAQIAMGLGTEDPARRTQIIEAGYKSLSSLVGEEKAKNTVQGLTTWLNRVPVLDETFKKLPWDTMERETKLETVLKAALAKDPVVAEVRKRVERYAHPGKIKSGTSKVVEGTLATVSWLSPGFAIPIGAEVALDAYIAATGGSEESKLEKELIYDKRIQSRLKVLDQEATLALDNYRFAIVTKNPSLLAFSEALIADMANEQVANEVLIGQVLTGDAKKQAQQVIPGIKESKTADQSVLKSLTKEITRL